MSAIALCIELADSRPVEEKKGHYEQLNTCAEAFSAAMDKCRQVYCEKERISISAPFPSRIIGEYIVLRFHSLYLLSLSGYFP